MFVRHVLYLKKQHIKQTTFKIASFDYMQQLPECSVNIKYFSYLKFYSLHGPKGNWMRSFYT